MLAMATATYRKVCTCWRAACARAPGLGARVVDMLPLELPPGGAVQCGQAHVTSRGADAAISARTIEQRTPGRSAAVRRALRGHESRASLSYAPGATARTEVRTASHASAPGKGRLLQPELTPPAL